MIPQSPISTPTDSKIFVIAEYKWTGRTLLAQTWGRSKPADELAAMLAEFQSHRVGWAGSETRIGNFPLVHPSRSKSLDEPIWEPVPGGGLVVSDDLHPSVVELFGTQSGTGAGRRIAALQLSPHGLELINGRYLTPTGHPDTWPDKAKEDFNGGERGLALQLEAHSKERIGADPDSRRLNISILGATALFPSTLGLIIFELGFREKPQNAETILEALHILTNRDRRQTSSFASLKQFAVPVTIADLIRPTLPENACRFEPWNRLFTYTAIALEEFRPGTGQDIFAARLARHYTEAYVLSDEQVKATIFKPFENVIHAYSLEGAASVVDGRSHFLKTQFNSRIEQSYLILAALAYHEHAYLVDMVQGTDLDDADQADSHPQSLEKLIGDFLLFRRRYRLPIVSDVDLHNQAYERLRSGLRNTVLIEKLTSDTNEAFQFLAQKSDRARDAVQRERKRQHAASTRRGAGITAFLMFGLTFLAFSNVAERAENLAGLIGGKWVPLTIGLVVGLVAGILQYFRLQNDADMDDEQMDDRMRGEGLSPGNSPEIAAAVAGTGHTHTQ
jgi:hypothetical protein